MMSREYFYLVAGLPDVLFDDKKLAVSPVGFREALKDDLHPADQQLISLLFLPYDHANVLTGLFDDGEKFDVRGVLSREQLELLLDKKSEEVDPSIPLYIRNVVKSVHQAEEPLSIHAVEKELTRGYFNFLKVHGNDFLKQYAEHEMTLRNVMTALNGRKFELHFENDLMGEGEIIEALKKSKARDFGLNFDIENLEMYLQAYEMSDILEREMKLDTIRWQFLDDATVFNYFTIEKVLVFMMKIFIIERWLKLDAGRGSHFLSALIDDLQKSYDFPDEYKLKHGKQ
jgi:hypothetical protein